MQLFKKSKQGKGSDNETGLKDKFEQKFKDAQELPENPPTRVVVLKYKSCCGCGCTDLDVERTVAYDSPLQNGDRIEDTMPGDNIL